MADKRTPAQDVADSVANAPVRFFVRKGAVESMLMAIAALQERPDTSGKFTRKVGQNRRALSSVMDSIREERRDLVKKHAETYPDGHDKAGEPTPVYLTDQNTREPVFKKDAAGNDTEERIVVPDQYNLGDPMAFQKDLTELGREWCVVECPGFKPSDFEAFKGIAGKITDPLMDLEIGSDSAATFAERAKALRDRVVALSREADLLDAAAPVAASPMKLVKPEEAVVDEEPLASDDGDGRTAP
jgi:hypothetical protein